MQASGTIARLDSAPHVLTVAEGPCYGLPQFAKSNAGPAVPATRVSVVSVSVSPCFGHLRSLPMKSRLIAAVLAVGLLCISSQANANGFLSILGGGYGGCGCDNVCGCDKAPSCGCDNNCCRQRCHQRCHSRCHRGCGCNSSCGCAAPSCAAPSCAAPAPTCAAAPSCGCDNNCGCNRGCGGCRQRCCKQRCCHSRCHRGCGCNNSCGCNMAPACGCGA
jgi:hypothetical protein